MVFRNKVTMLPLNWSPTYNSNTFHFFLLGGLIFIQMNQIYKIEDLHFICLFLTNT
jgi:hypothetical protein